MICRIIIAGLLTPSAIIIEMSAGIDIFRPVCRNGAVPAMSAMSAVIGQAGPVQSQ